MKEDTCEVGKKSDHFVGDYYVLFSKKAAEDESWNQRAQSILQVGSRRPLRLWNSGKDERVALSGFRETYRLFGSP